METEMAHFYFFFYSLYESVLSLSLLGGLSIILESYITPSTLPLMQLLEPSPLETNHLNN